MRTQILLTVHHTKPIPDLIDLVAGRAWTIGGVKTADAVNVSSSKLPRHDEPEPGEEFVLTASGWVEL